MAQVRGSIISVSKDPRGIIIRNRSVARNKGLSTWFLQVDIYIYIRWINVDQPCIPKKIDEAFIDYTEMRCHDSELYFICRPWWSSVFKRFRLIFWHCGWTRSKNEILSIKNEDYKFMIISYKSKLDKRNVPKLLQKKLEKYTSVSNSSLGIFAKLQDTIKIITFVTERCNSSSFSCLLKELFIFHRC